MQIHVTLLHFWFVFILAEQPTDSCNAYPLKDCTYFKLCLCPYVRRKLLYLFLLYKILKYCLSALLLSIF